VPCAGSAWRLSDRVSGKVLGNRLLQKFTLSFERPDVRDEGVLDGAGAATDTRLLISVLLPAKIALQVIQPC
jgi:N-acetylglucosamine kinase-like BadF-type ATPase